MTAMTGYDIPSSPKPGPRAWAQVLIAETKSVARDTAGLIIPIGMPSLLIVAQGAGPSQESVPGTGGRSVFEVFLLPLMLVMVISLIGIVNMPSFLAMYRKEGLLKRLAATPANPAMLLAAQVATSLIQTVIGIALALALSAWMFGLSGPITLWPTIGAFALTCVAMYAAGMVVAAISPTTNAAVAIGLITFFAMGALGGMFGGSQNLPEVLAELGRWLPYGAGVDALQHAWLGKGIPWQRLLALTLATIVGAVSAVRLFRWAR